MQYKMRTKCDSCDISFFKEMKYMSIFYGRFCILDGNFHKGKEALSMKSLS